MSNYQEKNLSIKKLADGLRVRCLELKGLRFESEEIESFLRFKLSATPEAFKETIDHMNYYEEANTEISVQKSNSEIKKDYEAIVKDDETVESIMIEKSTVKKDEKKAPSIGREEIARKGFLTEEQKKKVVCKFLKVGKCKHGWSGIG